MIAEHSPADPLAAVADVDCLIVGGGPAGLTAAVYLARFHRSCRVVDTERSRAAMIPRSRNYPGFPPGISGEALLSRLREQALGYGAELVSGEVTLLEPHPLGFRAQTADGSCVARRVILASGIEDSLPEMADVDAAIAVGYVRLCAICDGYEVDGERVAVYGEAECAISHAIFLRSFSDHVSVLCDGEASICEASYSRAREYGVQILTGPIRELSMAPQRGIQVRRGEHPPEQFDILYPCLGARYRSDLAASLGAERLESGALVVDEQRQTSVPGLYAIGDVVEGLKQLSVAIGQAAQAATAIHNALQPNPWRAALRRAGS